MEVSSHALDQGRTEGLPFRVGRAHEPRERPPRLPQDAGGRTSRRRRSSSRASPRSSTAVLNRDDPAWARFAARIRCRVADLRQRAPSATFAPRGIELAADGTTFRLHRGRRDGSDGQHAARRPPQRLELPRRPWRRRRRSASTPSRPPRAPPRCRGVRGRLERVEPAGDLHVFVDYAHTEDALRQVLGFLRTVGALPLTCVFGCGGDRDRTKRPKMGAVAADLADRVVADERQPAHRGPAGDPARGRGGHPGGRGREDAS